MIPENKCEWIGLRVLFQQRRESKGWFGHRSYYWMPISKGTIKMLTDGGNICVKENSYSVMWMRMEDFRIVEVLDDATEWEES